MAIKNINFEKVNVLKFGFFIHKIKQHAKIIIIIRLNKLAKRILLEI